MALVVLTPPVAALLTTRERVKAELGIAGTANDTPANGDILDGIIRDASDAINKECGRPWGFGVGKYTETLKGTGSQLLAITQTPILAISQIQQDTEVLAPLDPTDPATNTQEGYYVEDGEAGAIYRAVGWGQTVAMLSWGWEAYASRYILPGGTNVLRYTVTYTAGYFLPGQELDALRDTATGVDALYDATYPGGATPKLDAPPLPGSVERACLETVKYWWFTRRRDYTLQSGQVDNVRATIAYPMLQTAALPAVALGLLRNYRKVLA